MNRCKIQCENRKRVDNEYLYYKVWLHTDNCGGYSILINLNAVMSKPQS